MKCKPYHPNTQTSFTHTPYYFHILHLWEIRDTIYLALLSGIWAPLAKKFMKWFRSWVCQGQQGDNFPWVFSLGADFLLWGREWRGWGWGGEVGGCSCGDCTGTEGAASPGSWLVVVSKALSLSVWFTVSLLGLCHPVGTLLFFHQVPISPSTRPHPRGWEGILRHFTQRSFSPFVRAVHQVWTSAALAHQCLL